MFKESDNVANFTNSAFIYSSVIDHMRPKAEWAIYSEAMRARGIIVLVKSNLLVKNSGL